MEQRRLGTTGLQVSPLGIGTAKLGSGSVLRRPTEAIRLVHAALDAGVRLFDTADAYGAGRSEEILGRALHGRTDGVVVATKVGYRFRERRGPTRLLPGRGYAEHDFSPEHLRSAVIASLRRLRTDRIDLLQLHGPPEPVEFAGFDELTRLIDDGLVRAIGVGCEQFSSAEAWIADDRIGCVQLPCGVLDPEPVDTLIPDARTRGMGVIARGVLGGGLLARFVRGEDTGLDERRLDWVRRLAVLAAEADADLMQLAVWYATGTIGADAILIGMTSTAQLQDAVRMVQAPPPPGLLDAIGAVVGGGAR